MKSIRFCAPYITGKEIEYIQEVIDTGHLSGNKEYSQKCEDWLKRYLNNQEVLLTHSCTGALEMASLLIDIKMGDEVIMPSFTFPSTANAVVLRGGVPVFVDIRPDTLNIDETIIEQAITDRTKAIIPVHYAGVGCEMDAIQMIADHYGLYVVEDAAQGMNSFYNGKPLGSIGHLAGISFHETKNIVSGEGGALLINDERFSERAEIIWEKGTNRKQFFRGEVDKYRWVDIGSSYLPNELTAAFLFAQLENVDLITRKRILVWDAYHERLADLEEEGLLRRPIIPEHCQHNAHIYYILLNSAEERNRVLERLRKENIGAVFHYVPLHSSPAGKMFGKVFGDLTNTDLISNTIVRLPLFAGLSNDDLEIVISTLENVL